MSKLDIKNFKGIKNGKLFKKVISGILSTTMLFAAGCTENTDTFNDEKQNSINYDIGKIINTKELNEFCLDQIDSISGFNSYIFKYVDFSNGYVEFEEGNYSCFTGFTTKQKKAIHDCAFNLYLYLNNTDEESNKVDLLDSMINNIEEFYDGKSRVDVMRGILSKLLPERSHVSVKDNEYFVNENGTVSPITMAKYVMGVEDDIEKYDTDYSALLVLMCQGEVYQNENVESNICDELININYLMYLCDTYTEDKIIEFKANNGQSFLGNLSMFTGVLQYEGVYNIFYNEGLLDDFNLVYTNDEYFDVRVDDQTFYAIPYDKNIFGEIKSDVISNKELKKRNLLYDVVYDLPKLGIDNLVDYKVM